MRAQTDVPLGLDVYRRLFEAEGGPEAVGEVVEVRRRTLEVAAEIIAITDELGQDEGR